jgi:hypothetical protein
MQRAAAAWALAVFDIGHHLVARQARRQIATIARCRRRLELPVFWLWCKTVLRRTISIIPTGRADCGIVTGGAGC